MQKPAGGVPQDGLSRSLRESEAPDRCDVVADGGDPLSRLGGRPGEVLWIIGGKDQPVGPDPFERAAQSDGPPFEPGRVEVETVEGLLERPPQGAEPPRLARQPLLHRRDPAAEVRKDERQVRQFLHHAPGDDSRHRHLQVDLTTDDPGKIVLPEERIASGKLRRVHEDREAERAHFSIERRERRSIQRQPVHLRGDRRAPEAQLSHRPVDLPQAGLFEDGGVRQAGKPARVLTLDLRQPVVDEPAVVQGSIPPQVAGEHRQIDARLIHVPELAGNVVELVVQRELGDALLDQIPLFSGRKASTGGELHGHEVMLEIDDHRSITTSTTAGPPPSFMARIARFSAGAICAGSSTGPSPYAPKARAIAAKSTGGSSIRIPTTRFSTGRPRAWATSAW